MNDRAPMQHVDVGFTLENKLQDERGDALSLRYFEASFSDPQFRTSCCERKPRAIIFVGSRAKSGINIAATPTTASNPTWKEPRGSNFGLTNAAWNVRALELYELARSVVESKGRVVSVGVLAYKEYRQEALTIRF